MMKIWMRKTKKKKRKKERGISDKKKNRGMSKKKKSGVNQWKCKRKCARRRKE